MELKDKWAVIHMCELNNITDNDFIADLKREVRQQPIKPYWTFVYADENKCIEKRLCSSMTESEFIEFCEENWVETGYGFDCTGRPYTIAIEQYRLKNGKAWIYHTWGIDC